MSSVRANVDDIPAVTLLGDRPIGCDKFLRRDIWTSTGATAKEGDRVGEKLEVFRTRIEALCRPIVDRELSRSAQPTFFSRSREFFRKLKQAIGGTVGWRRK